MDLTSQVVNI